MIIVVILGMRWLRQKHLPLNIVCNVPKPGGRSALAWEGNMSRLVNHWVMGWNSTLLAMSLVLGGAFDAFAADASTPTLPASTSLKGLGSGLYAPTAKPAAGKPAAGKPAAGKPAAGKPAAGKSAAGKPAAGKPAAGKSIASTNSAGSAKPAAPAKPGAASSPAVVNKPAAVAKPTVMASGVAQAATQPGAPSAAAGPVLPAKPDPNKVAGSPPLKKTLPSFQKNRAPTQVKQFRQAKAKPGKTGKKAHTQGRGGSKRSKHRNTAVASAAKPTTVKSAVVPVTAKVPVKPAPAAVAVKKEPAKPEAAKVAPKGLAAKAPRDKDADKPTVGDDSMLDKDDDSGSGLWQVLMVFLLFTTASAGTFVYLKRRDASGSAARGEDSEDSEDSEFTSESKLEKEEISPALSDGEDAGLVPPVTAGPAPLFNSLTEPCPFEQYVEMQVAQASWVEQGVDLVSHLRTHFSVSMLEWSKISIYWKPRYLNSAELKQRFDQLEGDLKGKYGKAAS